MLEVPQVRGVCAKFCDFCNILRVKKPKNRVSALKNREGGVLEVSQVRAGGCSGPYVTCSSLHYDLVGSLFQAPLTLWGTLHYEDSTP